MSDLVYIDSFFKGELSPEDSALFEKRLQSDPEFANEVAFYCSTITAVKNQLAADKKIRFRELYQQYQENNKGNGPSLLRKFWPYMSAAAVVAGLIIGWYFYFSKPSPEQMADNYIKKNFETTMGVTMSDTKDSLAAAIKLYNENELPAALRLFENIAQKDSLAFQAKKMAGIVSLRLKLYDKATEYFTQLERLNLFSNPGRFYHALALIKRNQPGDKEMAKQLLKQVVDMNLEEKETARKWLKSL